MMPFDNEHSFFLCFPAITIFHYGILSWMLNYELLFAEQAIIYPGGYGGDHGVITNEFQRCGSVVATLIFFVL